MAFDFSVICAQTGFMFLIASVGAVLYRLGLLSDKAGSDLSSLLIYVCQPFLILKGFLCTSYQSAFGYEMLVSLLAGIIVFVFSYGIGYLFMPYSPRELLSENRINIFSVIFSNTTFIGIPLLTSLFPNNGEIIVFISLYNIPYNFLIWPMSNYFLLGKRQYGVWYKGIINPTSLALVISLPLFFSGVTISQFELQSDVFFQFIALFADMTGPIAMLILGIKIARISIIKCLKDRNGYLVAALRLLIIPVFAFMIIAVLTEKISLLTTIFYVSAMPTAIACVAFSEKLKSGSDAAVKNVAITTLLSVITLPLIYPVLQFLLYVI